jgi:hypothetical protein
MRPSLSTLIPEGSEIESCVLHHRRRNDMTKRVCNALIRTRSVIVQHLFSHHSVFAQNPFRALAQSFPEAHYGNDLHPRGRAE